MCGTKNNEERASWVTVGGPVKGSFAITDSIDYFNYFVSDIGVRVDDPCKAHDDNIDIQLTPAKTAVKDLKFHDGTDSVFWLRHEC